MSKTVYAALYSDCYHESALGILSIHESKAGALAAVEDHKAREKANYEAEYKSGDVKKDEWIKEHQKAYPWSDKHGTGSQLWEVWELEVKP
jgi:hypothetical protein